MKVHIKSDNKKITKVIKEGDCLWLSGFTNHGFTGNGALLKISDGQNINYLEKEDLINTYNINNVLKRTRGDMQNWGYDEKIKNQQSFSLWLIGPSASGKTTVSNELFKALNQKYKNLVHLDGDHARKIFLNESGCDPVSRSKNIKKYMSVVSWLNSFESR